MRRLLASLLMPVLVGLVIPAWAQPPRDGASQTPKEKASEGKAPEDKAPGDEPSVPHEEDELTRARKHFEEGLALVRGHEWGKALTAFELSSKLKPHAVTSYNEAACHRAIGRYTRARLKFREALARNRTEVELPEHLESDSKRYIGEIERVLARVQVSVTPKDARIAVDGAPLQRADPAVPKGQKLPILLAGIRAAGAGEALPARRFELWLDPGAHVFLLTRKGFSDVVVNRSLAPGAREKLSLELDRLPATLKITATEGKAVVAVDGELVGTAPVSVERPPGSYKVVVNAEGFEPYETQASVKAGQEVRLRARLVEESPSVLTRWWFWTGAGVVITGAIIGTYFATLPEPERPAVDGGTLGWTVPLP
jgi:hypothetical protein